MYILGDVIDRGPDGIRILKWIMLQPNVELLLGNHEAMLLACDFIFDEVTEEAISKLTGTKLNIFSTWISNSGQVTLDVLSGMRDKEIQYILEYLRERPLYEAITVNNKDFILVHSGLGSFRKDKKLSEYNLMICFGPDLTSTHNILMILRLCLVIPLLCAMVMNILAK